MRDANGRTVTRHELALTAEIERLKAKLEAHERLMDERDRRYTEGKESDQRAVEAALVANEKLTAAAFAASKEAIQKAEEGQKSYNATHNDLTRKMDAQYKDMMPRTEGEARFRGIEEKIHDLRESRSSLAGRDTAVERLVAASTRTMWGVLGIGVTVVLFVVGNLLLK